MKEYRVVWKRVGQVRKRAAKELSREQVEDRLEELLDLGAREESIERMPL